MNRAQRVRKLTFKEDLLLRKRHSKYLSHPNSKIHRKKMLLHQQPTQTMASMNHEPQQAAEQLQPQPQTRRPHRQK